MKKLKIGLVVMATLMFAGTANAVPVTLQGDAVQNDAGVASFHGGDACDVTFQDAELAIGTYGGSYYRHARGFIQFDISSVQAMYGASTRVTSAYLDLNVRYNSASNHPDSNATYGVYRMLDSWNENEVTFLEKRAGVPWVGQQSCPWIGGPWNTGDEVALMPTDEIVISWGSSKWDSGWHQWDVTADLNAWLSGDANNYGWFMRANTWDHAANGEDPYDWTDPDSAWINIMIGSDSGDAGRMPKLVLEVVPEPATVALLGLGLIGVLRSRKQRR